MRRVPLPPIVFYLSVALMVGAGQLNLLPFEMPVAFGWGGWLLVVGGVFFTCWGSHVFKRHKTNIKTFNDPEIFVKSGPFRFSRNPMYVGMITALIGTAMITGTIVGAMVLMAFILITAVVYIPHEEERMRSLFGAEYEEYAAKVRRWL